MTAGRPRHAQPGTLYVLAQELYWDLRRLAEGKTRLWFDKRQYERLKAEPIDEPIQFSPQEEARLRGIVEKEVQNGRTKSWQKADRLVALKRSESVGIRNYLAIDEAMKRIKVPGQLDVFAVLMAPDTTADQIRKICKGAFMNRTLVLGAETKEVEMPAWPIVLGSLLPGYLSQHAEAFVAAKRDPRFPCCDVSRRPTNRWKQLWFLARALAGAVCGVRTRTAINLVGSTRPEELFDYSRHAKAKRKPHKRQNNELTRS